MTDLFVEDKLLIHSARIARKFHQNVIEILKAPAAEFLMWDAAFQVILDDEREEAERTKARSKKK